MKKRILLLLIALCICFSCMLSACNKNDSEPTGDGATKTTERICSLPYEYEYPICFEDYTSLAEAFNEAPDSIFQTDKELYGDILPRYKMFVDYLTETKNIMIPMRNTATRFFSKENLVFRTELYDLPWIWFYGAYEESNFIVVTTYPAAIGIEGVTSDMSASEVIRLIDEDTANLHNYQQYTSVEYMYTKNLILADATVSALIWKFKDSNQIFVSFYYKDTLVKFYNYDKILPDEFWKDFSMESVADGALSSHPES